MTSALSALVNATALFVVAGRGVVTDPNTGNVQAVEESVEVQMFLRADKVEYTALPGVDVTETLYEGYAVAPTAIDPRVVVGTKGTLVFAGEVEEVCEVKALRMPYGNQGLIGDVVCRVLGEKVQLVARKR
jgi:hypothetical protein